MSGRDDPDAIEKHWPMMELIAHQERAADALERIALVLTHIAAILPDQTEKGSPAEDVAFATWRRIYDREFPKFEVNG